MNEQNLLTAERAKELIDSLINSFHVAQNNQTVVKHLLHVGFHPSELITHFGYSKEDVEEAEKNMDNYEDLLVIC